ncbi:MAG: hypothetical protein H6983_17965 [Ectothiorhodospiraceae bacterium]|nr:hypothetical protein [Ectothiorhodospiraceae bacterium]
MLVVSTTRLRLAEQALVARFPVTTRSLDALLLRHMKAFATAKRIDWQVVLRADAVPAPERTANRDWANLLRVVAAALPGVKAELAATEGHVLLTEPGLLARDDQMPFLGDLMSSTGRPGGPTRLWVLVPSDGQALRLTLDGQPLPVFGTDQWERIPERWLLGQREDAA